MPADPSGFGRTLPRPVDVRHDGRWIRGTLLAAYRSGGRWRGVVRYAVAPGEQYQQARWSEDLRAAEDVHAAEDCVRAGREE